MLVDYSSSSSENEEETPTNKVKLPLTLEVKSNNDDNVEDPTQHDGRIRSVKHERGNWATFVYIDVESNDELFQQMQKKLMEIDKDLCTIPELHISLSRLLIVKHVYRRQFLLEVNQALSNQKKFVISFANELELYCNDEGTRSFVGIKVTNPDLLNVVHEIDKVLQEFSLPKFYQPPSFHCSILWCLGNQMDRLKKLLPLFQNVVNDILLEETEMETLVTEICIKSGSTINKIRLK